MTTDPDKILLVDDDVDFLETLAKRLQRRGLYVETATSGEESLEKVRKTVFHVVILDLSMPGMDGIETLKLLQKRRPGIQVILLTGQATIKAAVEATRLGAVDVLEKPTDAITLIEKIRAARSKHIITTEGSKDDEVEDLLRKHGW
ncbi:MAG: response regulator [Proteobacteria bacterium]|nr:response regulator [Pseudomonadota bacterium]